MTSDGSSPGDDGDAGLATERDVSSPSVLLATHADLEPAEATGPTGGASDTIPEDEHLDSSVVEELTNRLPTSELVKIIKNALECGRRNVPFTESALLRAMTFGSSLMPSRQPASNTRAPRN
jgi:hypothetical protein